MSMIVSGPSLRGQRAILNFTPGPQGWNLSPRGMLTTSFTPRGEHSLLFRRMEGKQRILPSGGDNFTHRDQNSPLGDNFTPWASVFQYDFAPPRPRGGTLNAEGWTHSILKKNGGAKIASWGYFYPQGKTLNPRVNELQLQRRLEKNRNRIELCPACVKVWRRERPVLHKWLIWPALLFLGANIESNKWLLGPPTRSSWLPMDICVYKCSEVRFFWHPIFVERSSNKKHTRQPPPQFGNNCNLCMPALHNTHTPTCKTLARPP
jgi:hypothetical protein